MTDTKDSAVFILVTRAPTETKRQYKATDKKHYRVAVCYEDLKYEWIHADEMPDASFMWKIFYTCGVYNTMKDAMLYADYLEKEHNTNHPREFLYMTSCHFPTSKNATAGWE